MPATIAPTGLSRPPIAAAMNPKAKMPSITCGVRPVKKFDDTMTVVITPTTVLVSSNFFTGLTPQVMDGIFAFGFIAAAIGGLDSPVGAVVAGVSMGIILQFVGDFVNSNAIIITALIILIVSLMVRPNGLFTKSTARRV